MPRAWRGVRFEPLAEHMGPAYLRYSFTKGTKREVDALIELLAITRWDELDVLVVDMPPGLGDATLDTLRLASFM